MATLHNQISENKRRTFVLFLVFAGLIGLLGYLFGEILGANPIFVMSIALVWAGLQGVFSYYFSDKVALAVSRAKGVSKQDNAYLYNMVENLCIGSGLPVPRVYIMEGSAINAFATGRDPNHAAVAVTRGALERLENEELEGVLAHELSHVRNYDIRVMSIVVVLVGVIALMVDIFGRTLLRGGGRRERKGSGVLIVIALVALILAPIVAHIIRFAVSRQREYLADSSGALLTRYPEGLASALEKIKNDKEIMRNASSATAHLYISNPLKGGFSNLFSTHPPVDERIRRLRGMGGGEEVPGSR